MRVCTRLFLYLYIYVYIYICVYNWDPISCPGLERWLPRQGVRRKTDFLANPVSESAAGRQATFLVGCGSSLAHPKLVIPYSTSLKDHVFQVAHF